MQEAALEVFDFRNDFKSPVVQPRHDALCKIVHGLLDKELFLDGHFLWLRLPARLVSIDIIS